MHKFAWKRLAILQTSWIVCTQDWNRLSQIRTWTHGVGIWTQPKPLVFQLRSQTWLQDQMKLRFLISHHRKNSVRDKVIGKKWIYLDTERSTLLQTEGVWTISREWMQPRNLVWLVFIDWVISSAMGGLFQLFLGRGGDFQDLGHHPLLGLLKVPWNCHGTSGCGISVVDWGLRSGLVCRLGPIWF